MRTKLALEVQYLGKNYIGWQPQPAVEGRSVYEAVHEALQAVGIDSGPVAAGRTDKGTHAMSTWLTVGVRRSTEVCAGPARDDELSALCDALNQHLPVDIRAIRIVDAPLSAHAMTGSTGKTYSYFLLCGAGAAHHTSWLSDASWALPDLLDVGAMEAALPRLVGRNDFRALSAVQDPRRSTVRTIESATVQIVHRYHFPFLGCFDEPAADSPAVTLLQIRLVGDGFLKHQCRRIVGLLVRIGRKEEPPEALFEAITQPLEFDRSRVLEAPACGLWLEAVDCDAMRCPHDAASRRTHGACPKRAAPPVDESEQ